MFSRSARRLAVEAPEELDRRWQEPPVGKWAVTIAQRSLVATDPPLAAATSATAAAPRRSERSLGLEAVPLVQPLVALAGGVQVGVVLHAVDESKRSNTKQVVIVTGGPGPARA
jgi:hypothetical protein